MKRWLLARFGFANHLGALITVFTFYKKLWVWREKRLSKAYLPYLLRDSDAFLMLHAVDGEHQ